MQQSRIDNPDTLVQQKVHNTQDEDKQTKHTTQKTKKMNNQKPGINPYIREG